MKGNILGRTALCGALGMFSVSIATAAPAADEAIAFVNSAEKALEKQGYDLNRAAWVQATYVNDDTSAIVAKEDETLTKMAIQFAKEAAKYDSVAVPDDVRRKLNLMKIAITVPAPSDDARIAELAKVKAELEAKYAAGKYCDSDGKCQTLDDFEDILASPDATAAEKKTAWERWHTISVSMKPLYETEVKIANEGARELGFKDTGALWRSGYDMDPDAFAREVDRLWGQVKPLYNSLQCYVRTRLVEKYGDDAKRADGTIPVELTGNMWGQEWTNIYPLVAPRNEGQEYDVTALLQQKGYDPMKMAKTAEGFFVSLGLRKLPDSFWTRSQFVKPRDRDVQCHASAWDMDAGEDVRVKMCTKVNAIDFETLHHEFGHDYYYLAYGKQPYLFQGGANDGFHEAIGDFLALSMTPSYYKAIGLIDKEPDASGDTGLLLNRALKKVAFLPFGLMVDKWRWQVFSGAVQPADYNKAWWDLKKEYQGESAPSARPLDAFDPGAKAHIPGNTPYMRYFLSYILQFQFHRAACEQMGWKGPLHRCSIYGNKEVGKKLEAMLEMGQSKPWPDALETFTGSRRIDASALVDYFKPLKVWLDRQNKSQNCGVK